MYQASNEHLTESPVALAFRAAAERKQQEQSADAALVAELRELFAIPTDKRSVEKPIFSARGGSPSAKPNANPPLQSSHQGFGVLKIFSQNGELGRPVESGDYTFAALRPAKARTQEIRIGYSGVTASGVRLFRLTQNEILDCGAAMKPLVVKVQWQRKGVDDVPSLAKPRDVNFAFLRPDGSFIHLEVAVVTRAARGMRGFFLTIQTGWRGWVAETDAGHTFVPSASANAYPGVDYEKSAVGGTLLVAEAVKRGWVAKAAAITAATWQGVQPVIADDLKERGYESAVVRWFNASGGYGQLILEDGSICFAHMNVLLDEHGNRLLSSRLFPLLHPMEGVAVKVTKAEKGLQAEWVHRR